VTYSMTTQPIRPPLAAPGTPSTRIFIPLPVSWDRVPVPCESMPVVLPPAPPVPVRGTVPAPRKPPVPPPPPPPEYVQAIRLWFRNGMHLRSISARLNRLGYLTPDRGTQWTAGMVRQALMENPVVRRGRRPGPLKGPGFPESSNLL
jgi:hypothetical protein